MFIEAEDCVYMCLYGDMLWREGGEGQRPLVEIEESLCRITRNLLFLCTSCSVTDTVCEIKTFVAPL